MRFLYKTSIVALEYCQAVFEHAFFLIQTLHFAIKFINLLADICNKRFSLINIFINDSQFVE